MGERTINRLMIGQGEKVNHVMTRGQIHVLAAKMAPMNLVIASARMGQMVATLLIRIWSEQRPDVELNRG